MDNFQHIPFPSLSGTCHKRCKPTHKPNLRQEPSSPSRQSKRESAAKIIKRLIDSIKTASIQHRI
jgi:hypothetical protein